MNNYSSKLDKPEEMDKFLKIYNLLRLNHEEIKNQDRSITSKEIKSVIKNVPTNKSSGPDNFSGKFYQTFKELIPILLKLFKKKKRSKLFPIQFMRPALS